MYMYIYIPNLLYIHCYIRGNLSNKTICVKMMLLALVAARTKKYMAFFEAVGSLGSKWKIPETRGLSNFLFEHVCKVWKKSKT